MSNSKIQWTQKVWNPTTGCTKISAGCRVCYAVPMSARLKAMGQKKYRNGFKLTLHPDTLDTPRKWKKPAVIFVNSMSDLFHDDVPLTFIMQVFQVMNECPQHTFQILTKRAKRLAELAPLLSWTPNIWMGVSVENQEQADLRIPYLLKVPAAIRFLSMEPLLGAVIIPDRLLKQLQWVICGGESGKTARPMHPDWVRDIQALCCYAGVPFFFKQWGEYLPACQDKAFEVNALMRGTKYKKVKFPSPHNPGKINVFYKVGKHNAGNVLDGKTWEQFPERRAA